MPTIIVIIIIIVIILMVMMTMIMIIIMIIIIRRVSDIAVIRVSVVLKVLLLTITDFLKV